MSIDPVCKKEVDEKNAPGGKVRYWGEVFHFCSEECRKAFRRQPHEYAPEIAEGRGPGYDKARTSETWRT
ncbi:MAG: YHS domain-containing protein [Deltaproteobacteria bacterium]|nr:YHS domain-containing protein [Deltaproteobacteria bacterium]